MSCWNKEQLEQMLRDVVNELDLSDTVIGEHGQAGTPPAELVRMVLDEKDQRIRNLQAGMVDIAASDAPTIHYAGRDWREAEMCAMLEQLATDGFFGDIQPCNAGWMVESCHLDQWFCKTLWGALRAAVEAMGEDGQ